MIPVHLFLHVVVQSVSAKAAGCTVKRIVCEHCGVAYIYQLRRKATGTAQSYMFMGRINKKQAAEIAAQRKLQKVLAQGIDPVPCPECGKLQGEMLRLVRKGRLRVVGMCSGLLGVTVAILWICTDQWIAGPKLIPTAQIATVLFLACLTLSLMWVVFADPNARAHRRTRAVLGAKCRAMPADEFDALLAGEPSPVGGRSGNFS